MRSAPPVSDKGPVPSPPPWLREPPPGSRVVSRYSCLSVSSFRKRERERGERERQTERGKKGRETDTRTDGVGWWESGGGATPQTRVEQGLSELDRRKTAAAGSAEWTKLSIKKKNGREEEEEEGCLMLIF